MDMNKDYGDGANPVILKSEFIMSLCEQLIGGTNLGAKQKSIIDRCTASVYRTYQQTIIPVRFRPCRISEMNFSNRMSRKQRKSLLLLSCLLTVR